jgi:hypothetical protein
LSHPAPTHSAAECARAQHGPQEGLGDGEADLPGSDQPDHEERLADVARPHQSRVRVEAGEAQALVLLERVLQPELPRRPTPTQYARARAHTRKRKRKHKQTRRNTNMIYT